MPPASPKKGTVSTALSGKEDMKTVYLCKKCQVPLHIICFKDRIHTFLYSTVFSFFLSFFHLHYI
jgi:hypothetical protein